MTQQRGADDARLRDFLADSLALWGVAGTVEAGELDAVAVIRADAGATVWVERFPGRDLPFRWLVRSRGGGGAPDSPRQPRPRPCGSLVGMLNAIRVALGVDRGSAVRVAPAPGAP